LNGRFSAALEATPSSTGGSLLKATVSSTERFPRTGVFLTGSPPPPSPRPPSNIDIKDPVGGIGSESTATSAELTELIAPTLAFLLGAGDAAAGFGGLGLPLRLAASVAAMKLVLFGSTLGGVWRWLPYCWFCWPEAAASCCILPATMLLAAAASMSGRPLTLPPVLWELSVAAARAPLLPFDGGGGAGFFFLLKAREAPRRAAAGSEDAPPPGAWGAP
jgi:hypothetical protein